jgi:hypothetical protein
LLKLRETQVANPMQVLTCLVNKRMEKCAKTGVPKLRTDYLPSYQFIKRFCATNPDIERGALVKLLRACKLPWAERCGVSSGPAPASSESKQ